jgi:ribose-phosphate pyrophosphokinase
MRIYTPAGDLAFKVFSFPDGQPHFKLETHDVDFRSVVIETAIRNPAELFQVLAVNNVLRRMGYTEVSLDIRYLLAARMDRPISAAEPFTLDVVASVLNGCGFARVRILDAHSPVATSLIRNSVNLLAANAAKQAADSCGTHIVICPDKGAVQRTQDLTMSWARHIIYCTKERDMSTGQLSQFRVQSPVDQFAGQSVLIVDDICDGGGTFTGLAKVLREAGAKSVNLFVTHGIFSKGLNALLTSDGIDKIFTTDSYFDYDEYEKRRNTPIRWSAVYNETRLTVIPISMKEL